VPLCPLDGHPTIEDNLTLKAPKILQITPYMEPLGLMRTTTHGVDTMFKNSAEGGKPDMSDFVGFWKNQENSAKFGKIRPKRTGNDRGTVKTGNSDIQSVSPINQHFFENQRGDFRANFVRNRTIFLPKIGKWNEKTMKNNDITSTKFVHANNP
jgi:hypothetical protein